MARFIKVTDSKGKDLRINIDWIAALTEASEPGYTVISFGGGNVSINGTHAPTILVKGEATELGKDIERK